MIMKRIIYIKNDAFLEIFDVQWDSICDQI